MQDPAKSGSHRPFTFRQCLLLCLPALVIGFILRASLLTTIPEVFYGADSNSYFSTASDLWNQHEFSLSKKRRYLYPLLLAALPPLPGTTAVATSVIQHLVGLATIVGIGWIAGQLTVYRRFAVPLATILAAVWPRMLWYEHEMIAEVFVLAAVVATAALALPLSRLRTSRGLTWFLIAAAMIIAFKPHGKPFWVAFIALGAVYTWNKFRWEKKHWAILAASVFILVNGGSGSQGSWLLLSSSLPLVNTEGESMKEYRQILRPIVEESRGDLINYAMHQGRYKKQLGKKGDESPLGPVWGELVGERDEFSKVAKRLAIEGILSNPFTYAAMIGRKTMLALADNNPGAMLAPDKFWSKQLLSNGSRWEKRPAEMRLIYETDEAGFNKLVEEGTRKSLWFTPAVDYFDEHMAWTHYRGSMPGTPPVYGFKAMGFLAVFGLLMCLTPRRFMLTAIVWAPALFYYLVIYGVGDAVTRYLHAADWCWFVVIVIGLDTVAGLVARLFNRQTQPLPAEQPAELTPV